MTDSIKSTELTGSDQEIVSAEGEDGAIEYYGFALRETSGSGSATVYIRTETSDGKIIDVIELAPSESARELYIRGLEASGIWVEVVSGAIEGSVRWARE